MIVDHAQHTHASKECGGSGKRARKNGGDLVVVQARLAQEGETGDVIGEVQQAVVVQPGTECHTSQGIEE